MRVRARACGERGERCMQRRLEFVDVMAQNSLGTLTRAVLWQCSWQPGKARQGKAMGAHFTRITCISLFVSTELITACTYGMPSGGPGGPRAGGAVDASTLAGPPLVLRATRLVAGSRE